MSGRALVSYADITQPPPSPQSSSTTQPPPKKRKKGGSKSKHQNASSHRNDRGGSAYTSGLSTRDDFYGTEEDESRELTHEDIWDDSALIDAWNAATEEYEAYHGTDKDWKNQPPSTKSALWYNIPPSPKTQSFTSVQDPGLNLEEALANHINGTSTPYDNPVPDVQNHQHPPVPSFDPTSFDPTSYGVGASGLASVSQDEAFSRALSAMYWGGYWTAVYHCHRNLAPQPPSRPPGEDVDAVEDGGEGKDEDMDADEEVAEVYAEDDEEGGFVSTQR